MTGAGERTCIIVGGGAIGCAIAWRLAQRGWSITVLERGVPGTAATAAAAGMLSPLGELRHAPALAELGVASLAAWPGFADALRAATGIDVELRPGGTLHIALREADDAALEDVHLSSRGSADALTGDEARALEPALSPAVRSAVLVHGDASVDNRRLGHALWHAAQGSGAVVRPGTEAAGLLIDAAAARVRGVRLHDGEELTAPVVVIAAGAWSARFAPAATRPPVFPVRGEMSSVGPAAHNRPIVGRMIHGPHGYLIPRRNGDVLVGATVDETGFAPGPTPGGIARMIAMAGELVPGIVTLPMRETWAGYRPGTPDGLPLLGPDARLAGLVWATGHFRNGILLAPITADRIAALVAGERWTDLQPFSPGRFA